MRDYAGIAACGVVVLLGMFLAHRIVTTEPRHQKTEEPDRDYISPAAAAEIHRLTRAMEQSEAIREIAVAESIRHRTRADAFEKVLSHFLPPTGDTIPPQNLPTKPAEPKPPVE